jgi:uncharacterized protein with PIN domain
MTPPTVPPAFTPDQRRALERLAAADGPLRCPACGGPLTRNPVGPTDRVSYVRHRVWLICTACRRSASVDPRPTR